MIFYGLYFLKKILIFTYYLLYTKKCLKFAPVFIYYLTITLLVKLIGEPTLIDKKGVVLWYASKI
mgnify:FL=1